MSNHLLKRFVSGFLAALLSLTLVFAFGDLMLRLSTLSSVPFSPQMFFCLLPVMIMLAMPVAVAYAVATVIGDMHHHDELLFVWSFRSLSRSVYGALFLFSLIATTIYLPLQWSIAPRSYLYAKNKLIHSMKEHFSQLPAQTFHAITPRATFFFASKEIVNGQVVFKDIFLSFKNGPLVSFDPSRTQDKLPAARALRGRRTSDGGQRYFITAQRGEVGETTLFLYQGSVNNKMGKSWYNGTFAQTDINWESFFASDKKGERPVKFLTMSELAVGSFAFEYYKRLAQIIWLFFLPFFSYWLALVLRHWRSTLLMGVVVGGGLFLLSYFAVSIAQSLINLYSMILF